MAMKNQQRIIRAAMFTPTRTGWGLPLLFWGKFGVGKSDVIESIAESLGMPVEVLSPGERGEGAFGVTPVPRADGLLGYPAPEWTEKFTKGDGGFLFLDEINHAAPAIQSPMFGLLLKRRIGGITLDGRVRMMAAANEVSDGGGVGWDLSPGVANRVGHLSWDAPNESEWTEWLMGGVDEAPAKVESAVDVEKRVMAAWHNAWAKVRGPVAGFVRANPAALHKQPATGSPEASKAWPSHRSWEFATRALASAQVHGLSEADGDMFASAFVGAGVLGELAEYRAKADLPDPVDVLDGKVKFKPDFKRLDRTFAVLSSTSSVMMNDVTQAGGALKAKKDSKVMKRFDVLVNLLQATSEGAVDLCWGPAKAIARASLYDATDDSKKLMRRMLPMINAVEGK